MSLRLPLSFAFAVLLAAPVLADEAVRLDRYLQRLGLSDLRLLFQEEELAAAPDEKTKAARAKTLSDLYSQRLLEAAEEPQRFAELVLRVERLLRDYPAVDSPQLRVMLLQAEYQRAETEALAWIDDPADETHRTAARTILEQLTPQLARRRQELSQALTELQTRFDAVEAPTAGPSSKDTHSAAALEQELGQLQMVLARALFFEGWSNFFFGLVESSHEQSLPHFAAAEQAFATLLEVNTEEKLELQPDTLGLESVWRARSLLGLAAAFSATGKEGLAKECFVALTHPTTVAGVRETALYWHLLALVGSQRLPEAKELAASEFRNFSAGSPVGKLPACVLLVRSGWGNPKASRELEQLAQLGLEGLAKLKQYEALSSLVAKYRPTPKPSDGFYALWGKGRLAFADAEKSKQAADFSAAAAWFTSALELPVANDDPLAAAQCRYSLAWCHYRQTEYEAALRLFRQAATQLKTLGDESAVQSAWMVFTCHQQLFAQSKEERHKNEALEALLNLKRDYPTSSQANQADLMLARLNAQGDSPEAALKTLSSVPSNSPNYLAARFELCQVRHRLWSQTRGAEKETLAKELPRDAETYLAAVPQSEGTRRLRVALLAIDALLAGENPAWDAAEKLAARVTSAAKSLADNDSLAPEWHYRQLQFAQQNKQSTTITQEADWLTKHAAGSAYELPALVVVARGADEAFQAASPADQAARRREAIAAYARLVQLWGESPEILASKKNALIANSKLAQYEFDSGQFEKAAARLEKIVAAYPSDRKYLRRAGLASVQSGNFAQALPHWDKLTAGSDSASEGWYEAKYYQLLCLTKSDPAAAKKVWRQFQLLHPEIKSSTWKEKFATLGLQE